MSEDKFCPKCIRHLPKNSFPRNKANQDGLGVYCRMYQGKISARKWYLNGGKEKLRKSQAIYRRKNGRHNYCSKEQRWARKTLENALTFEKISKKPCDVCGVEKVEGHHQDYRKPLEVIWLCNKHHRQIHDLAKEIVRIKSNRIEALSPTKGGEG